MIPCEKETKPITKTNEQTKISTEGAKESRCLQGWGRCGGILFSRVTTKTAVLWRSVTAEQGFMFFKLQTNLPERQKDVFYFKLVNLW